jgi:hypothetical protein
VGRSRDVIDTSFNTIYQYHFLNYGEATQRYSPLYEDGDLLIICHDPWLPNVQPLVTHKTATGIPTTLVGVSTIGNNHTAIKNYIQNAYNTGNLSFVLLVGDAAQVATPSASGGASDPTYAKLAGGDDYPEIMVGRFSAETAAQVDTQVQRTLTYETTPAPMTDWFWKGTGIASAQGAGQGDEGQADWVHMDEIRQWLLAFGYTHVDQFYDTTGATAAQVTTALNAGRGIINYCGHGSTTSWSTTGFSNTHINALVNDDMLPFIVSVACVNGNFPNTTCFGEAWLRATNPATSAPTGAIGIYCSSINQSWAPPMEAQDEFNLLLCAEAYISYGALCYAGSCSMMDDYGSGGVSMFNTWHIFGDPSLRIAVTCVDAGTVTLDRGLYACEDSADILVVDCGLNLDDLVIDTGTVTVSSDSEPAGEIVTVTELGPASGQFAGSIAISATNTPGVLWVAPGDTITVTYIDADDGQGNTNVVVTATAAVDCTPPVISGVQATNIEPHDATVSFTADEPVRGVVHYGLGCGALNMTAQGSGYSMSPTVALTGLQDDTTYYYAVEAYDEAGNMAIDDNGGNCYMFTTPQIPDYYTELFDGGDNDLDNTGLMFTPNGTVDFYAGCAEPITALPTNPTGGTPISLSDDDYEQITLVGATVSLYGVNYSSFYVGSNGFITFNTGDTDTTESLTDHFEQPRISGLFDDLNPASGGTVSWKQLPDRVAVTYDSVPEYSVGGSNTFQIEMFFDGTITISYLGVSASDGLAGLSEGNGVSPDYYETDLTNMGPCQDYPPTADDVYVDAPWNNTTTITLQASDDGFPIPPGALSYIITSLPAEGTLVDPGSGAITTVPFTLANYGNQVEYVAEDFYLGADTFEYKANDGGIPPEGGDSNLANVYLTVYGVPAPVHTFTLDADPGWACDGMWAWGQPTGGGSWNGDPTSGHTGTCVYGYNLDGDYENDLLPEYLTSPAINCSQMSDTELHFARWLAVEAVDTAAIEASTDGMNWTTVWVNTHTISDASWQLMSYDISAIADGQPTVYVRWVMGPTDGGFTMAGWNIDDVEVWGIAPPTNCLGDANCSGAVDFADIDYFVAALGGEASWITYFQIHNAGAMPPCPYEVNDLNGGGVEFTDVQPFINHLGQPCDPM